MSEVETKPPSIDEIADLKRTSSLVSATVQLEFVDHDVDYLADHELKFAALPRIGEEIVMYAAGSDCQEPPFLVAIVTRVSHVAAPHEGTFLQARPTDFNKQNLKEALHRHYWVIREGGRSR